MVRVAVSYTHLERSREGNDLIHAMNASGAIAKTAMAFGQMNEPPGSRMRVAMTGLTMAEYFRDEMCIRDRHIGVQDRKGPAFFAQIWE